MKFRIHNESSTDFFVVKGNTIQECQDLAKDGVTTRNWKNPWSEEYD